MFSSISNINSYVKNLMMQKKIDGKKNGDSKQNTQSIFKLNFKSNTNDFNVQMINAKLRRGEELSAYELGYLSKNAPELYAKAVKLIKERKDFSAKLQNCKTEEEVRSLKATYDISVTIVSKNQSGSDPELIAMRLSGINNVYTKFLSSQKYKKITESDIVAENKTKIKNRDTVEISDEIKRKNKKIADSEA